MKAEYDVTPERAIELVMAAARPLEVELVATAEAAGRVLREARASLVDRPAADDSALDGFACLVEDTTGASSERPVELELIGEAAAGRPFSGRLQSGQAVRIATGGLLPGSGPRPGGKPASRTATIGVVGVEHAGARGDRVVLTRPASAAATRPQGQDLRAGSTYLSAGSLLHSASVGLAAAMGHGSLPVSRRPRVAIVTTGDEVVAPGAAILPGQLFDANAAALSAAARKAGCEVVGSRYVRDEAAQLSAVLAELGEQQQRPDLVITTGGVSRGEHDIVRDVLLADDRLVFWRVAVRPAGPTLFGDFAGLPVLGLPGNPVSSLVGFLLFGRAFIDTALGSSATLPYFDRFTVRLADDFRPQAKTVFHRAHLRFRDGVIEATAFDNQSSGVLRSLVEADALVMTPPNREGPRSPTSGARGATASGAAIDLRRHL